MKALSIIISMVFILGYACSRHDTLHTKGDDDVATAKVAFATMLQYQKSDDIRSTNLFSQNCTVMGTVVRGNNKTTTAISADVFRRILIKEMALKLGNNDKYENVIYSKKGTNVIVTATICYAGSTNRGPMVAIYGRDSDGVLRIQTWNVTAFANETEDKLPK